MAEQLGSGITITFESGFFAKILDATEDEMTRPAIKKTSHAEAATGWDLFVPGAIVDPGGITVEVLHNGAVAPPIDQPAENVTVGLPDGTGYTVSGFMIGYRHTGAMEDMIKGTARLKFSGARTFDTTPT